MEKRPKANIILNDLKTKTEDFPGIYLEYIEKKDGPPKDKDIEIKIVNNNAFALEENTKEFSIFLILLHG